MLDDDDDDIILIWKVSTEIEKGGPTKVVKNKNQKKKEIKSKNIFPKSD